MSQSRPGSRAFSCLIKGPLGCLSFVIGAILVLVLFFPPVGGRLADRWIEDWFAARHQGRLELGDAWMGSLYGRQRVERVILRDPAGEEVLSGMLSAPSLAGILEGRQPYGPIELTIENMRISLGADGVTNLDRALAPTPDAPPRRDRERLRTELPFTATLRVIVMRLRLDGPGEVSETLQQLQLEGQLEWTPESLRISLVGGESQEQWAAFRVDLDARRSLVENQRGSAQWTMVNAPVALSGVGALPLAQLARLAGARLDRIEVLRRESELEVRAHDEGFDLTLRGHYQEDPPALVGAGLREVVELQVGAANLELLRPFLPCVAQVDADGARVALRDYRWLLQPRLGQISGDLQLELAARAYQLDATVPWPAAATAVLQPGAGSLDRTLHLEEGRLRFEDVALPLRNGRLMIDGHSDLASHEFAFELSTVVDGRRTALGSVQGPPPVPPPAAPRAPTHRAGDQ